MLEILQQNDRLDLKGIPYGASHVLNATSNVKLLDLVVTSGRLGLNMLDAMGYSPFHYAIVAGDVGLATRMLLNGRTNPNLLSALGLHASALATNPEVWQLLRDIDRVDQYLMDNRHYAALLEKGDLNK
jgi:hypothetical protein